MSDSLERTTANILDNYQQDQEFSFLDSAGHAISATAVSSAIQLADIPAAIGNMFGADNEMTDIEGAIYKQLGADAADYYAQNKGIVDTVGFVATSFVPGMAGIKGLRLGQEAIKAASKGKQLHPFYKALTKLSSPNVEAAMVDVKVTSAIEQNSKLFRAESLKAMALGTQQQVLEAMAFESAVAFSMGQGEVLGDMTTGQLIQNMALGTVIGAGIGAVFTGMAVKGANKFGAEDHAGIWNKYSLQLSPDDTLPDSLKAIHNITNHNMLKSLVEGGGIEKDIMAAKLGDAGDISHKLHTALSSNSTKLLATYENAAKESLSKLTRGDKVATEFLFNRWKELPMDKLADDIFGLNKVDSGLGIAEVLPAGRASKIERLLRKEEKLLKTKLDIDPIQRKVVYADFLSTEVYNGLPSYISLQDLGAVPIIKQDHIYIGRMKFKVNKNLAYNTEFDLLAPREHEARAMWMNAQSNKYFTGTASILDEDVGAMDIILSRLKNGKLKPEEFKDSTISIRDKSGQIVKYDLVNDFDSLVKHFFAKKYDLAENMIKHRRELPVHASSLSAKADALRDITGVPFKVSKLKEGTRGQFTGQYDMVMRKKSGDIEIDAAYLANAPLRQVLKTIMHEFGHLRDYSGKLDGFVFKDDAVRAEAVRLSKQARPQSWKQGSNAKGATKEQREHLDYLNSDKELAADARAMLSVMSEDELSKYPLLQNAFGYNIVRADERLRRLIGYKMDAPLSTEAVARSLNINPDVLTKQAALNFDTMLFRDTRLSATNNPKLSNPFEIPYYHKLTYDSNLIKTNANEVRGMAKIQAEVVAYEQESAAVANNLLGEFADYMPDSWGEFKQALTTTMDAYGTGGGGLTASNRDYGHVGSFTKQIGAMVIRAKEEAVKAVNDIFTPFATKATTDREFALGFSALDNKMRSLPYKYVYDDATKSMVIKEVQQYRNTLASGVDPTTVVKPSLLDDARAADVIELPLNKFVTGDRIDTLADMIKTHISLNGKHLEAEAKINLIRHGRAGTRANLTDVYYPLPPNLKKTPHFAFVFDERVVTGRTHSHMLFAATKKDLEKMVSKITSDDELGKHLTIRSKDEISDYYRGINEFDLAKEFNSVELRSELQRKGLDAPYFIENDPKVIMQSLMDFHGNSAKATINRAVELKYSGAFKTLENASKRHKSTIVSSKDITPFDTYAKEMLGLSNASQFKVWKDANNVVENIFSSLHTDVFGKLGDDVTETQLLAANNQLARAGMQNAFVGPMTMELANKKVSNHVASKFVSTANSLLSFFVLRTDPLHAINNLIGHNVLYQSELRDLLQLIRKKDPESGLLKDLFMELPGKGDATVLHQGKLVSKAVADYWKRPELTELYTKLGYNMDYTKQVRALLDDIAVEAVENDVSVMGKYEKLLHHAKSKAKGGAGLMEKYSLNRFSEEMTNFVSARTAHMIVDEAVRVGVMDTKSKWAYINTFVNRVRGTYVAAQRPAMFQGPIGMSMALFQTYQLNLMQQLFRYGASGRLKTSAMMMGLQGSIYGAHSLPGYHAVNSYVAGLEGNPEHTDITTGAYRALGVKGADWLMYGAAANIPTLLGHDDFATNIYTRGDLNPRQITIVPINPMDAPWFSGWSKFFTNIYDTTEKLANGADLYTTIASGIEHNGISRPLSGLGKAMQAAAFDGLARSTTNSAKLIATYDLLSITTGINLLGGKTLTEAKAIEALYNKKAYDEDKRGDMAELKTLIRHHAANKTTLDQEQYLKFMEKYVAKGGDIKRYRGFVMEAIREANESTVQMMADAHNSKHGRDLQAILGGDMRELYPTGDSEE